MCIDSLLLATGAKRCWLATICVILALTCVAHAGNSTETTWIPMLPVEDLAPRVQTRRLKLPRDVHGIVRVPLFLTGRCKPPPEELIQGPLDQMMVGVDISVGGRKLAPWAIGHKVTGFLLSLGSIDANPAIKDGEIELEFDVKIVGTLAPAGIEINSVGCPDLLIAGDNRDGPFDSFVDSLAPGPTHDYFEALRLHLHGDLDPALAYFTSLTGCGDERIARLSRRNMRVLRYQQRPPTPNEDDVTRRAAALYLQTIGQFGMGFAEAMYGGQVGHSVSDNWSRMGELADRMGWPIERVAESAESAGRTGQVGNPVEWHQLVIVLGEEEVERTGADGKVEKVRKTVTVEQVERAYLNWYIVSQLVYGASQGMLRIHTEYAWIANTSVLPYAMHEGRAYGPADSVLPARGIFDGVTSLRPGGLGVTVGADTGPNGAALSDVAVDADAETLFKAWRQQLDWAVTACEPGPGFVSVDESAGCGVRPSPSVGYGLRASMRHYMTPMMYRGIQVAMPARDEGYVRLWMVNGVGVDSATHLVNLAGPNAVTTASSQATAAPRATCWVFSPVQQFVAAWLGFSGELSLNVNGQMVRRGDYRPAGKWTATTMTDLVMSHAMLMPGWNRFEVSLGAAAARDGTRGFSLRLADWNNDPLPGIAVCLTDPPEDERAPMKGTAAATAPATPVHHRWDEVAADYHESLPRLDDAMLARLTGAKELTARGVLVGDDLSRGFVAWGAADAPAGQRYRTVPEQWSATDRDVEFNNVLDWSREDVAAFAYQRGGAWRALLLLRPDTARAYLTLLQEEPSAGGVAKGTPMERLVGYVQLPVGRWSRTLLVADVSIGKPDSWPQDEEDLLRLPVSTMKPRPPASQPVGSADGQFEP